MKKIISHILIAAIIFSALFCSGCNTVPANDPPQNKTSWDIDWKMHGMWIGEDGKPEKEIDFSISGNAFYDPQSSESAKLTMNVTWPDTFRFRCGPSNDFQPRVLQKDEEKLFFIDMLLCDDTQTGSIMPANFGLAPEQEYFLIYWDDVPGYLIASTNPDATQSEIEDFFSNMMTDERFQ